MTAITAPLLIHDREVLQYAIEAPPEGWHMRQLHVNGFTWIEQIEWVLSNGWYEHIVFEDDYGGQPVFLVWTEKCWRQVRDKWRETMKHTSPLNHHGGFSVLMYLSDEAEIHYKMKFD